VARRCGPLGQDENKEDSTMSTTTVRRPARTKRRLPEWRRICHFYEDDSQISICGTARRKPGEDHLEPECNARGHTICVVCTEFRDNWNQKD
jgi:hypothetical protein